jgi:hypothetical protein
MCPPRSNFQLHTFVNDAELRSLLEHFSGCRRHDTQAELPPLKATEVDRMMEKLDLYNHPIRDLVKHAADDANTLQEPKVSAFSTPPLPFLLGGFPHPPPPPPPTPQAGACLEPFSGIIKAFARPYSVNGILLATKKEVLSTILSTMIGQGAFPPITDPGRPAPQNIFRNIPASLLQG